MSQVDWIGDPAPAKPFRDIRSTREAVAAQKAELALRLKQLLTPPPADPRRRPGQSSSRVAGQSRRGAQDRWQQAGYGARAGALHKANAGRGQVPLRGLT